MKQIAEKGDIKGELTEKLKQILTEYGSIFQPTGDAAVEPAAAEAAS